MEVNNMEAMYEALREVASIDIGNFQEPIDGDSSAIYQNAKYDDNNGRVFKGKEIPAFYGAIWYRNLKMAVDKAKAALAAPPRNCDKYATYDAAKCAWYKEPIATLFSRWLFAPATERKGDCDGK